MFKKIRSCINCGTHDNLHREKLGNRFWQFVSCTLYTSKLAGYHTKFAASLCMVSLLCSSSSDTFGMVLEPCSETFLLVLTQILMLKWNFEHSKNLEIQLQEDF